MIARAVGALALSAAALFTAPAASADVLDCQIQGILVIVALTGPVTVCSVDTTNTHNTQIDPSLQVDPHLFSKAP